MYAYIRSKQKVQDKVGPLEGSDRNIITEGFLMAENLNEYFSSVFSTGEDISALPLPETKFEGRDSDYLGQLIVTPQMVAMKIRNMKDNKSPSPWDSSQITIGNCRTNQRTAFNSVQFIIREGNSSVRMERSKHCTII